MSDRTRRRPTPTPRRRPVGDELTLRPDRDNMWDDGSQQTGLPEVLNSRYPEPNEDPQPRQLRRDSTARPLYKKGGTVKKPVKKLAVGGPTTNLAGRIANARGRMSQMAQPRGIQQRPLNPTANGPLPRNPLIPNSTINSGYTDALSQPVRASNTPGVMQSPILTPTSPRGLGFLLGNEVSGGNKKGGLVKKGQKPATVVKKSPMKKGKK